MVSSSIRSKNEDLSKNLSQISNDRGSLTSGTIHESLMRVFSAVAIRHFQKVSDEETAAFEVALLAPACEPESGEVLLALELGGALFEEALVVVVVVVMGGGGGAFEVALLAPACEPESGEVLFA